MPLVVVIFILLMGCLHGFPFDLQAHLATAISNRTYRTPTAAELDLAKELFKQTLLSTKATLALKSNWAQLGFELREVTQAGETLLLVTEPTAEAKGGGWYLFRMDPTSKIVIQSPHARNDVHTGLIGLQLFLVGRVRAYAASTITRHVTDVAHSEGTYFQAFTIAYAEICSTGLVVQLHGFDSKAHTGIKADIVASAGTNRPMAWLRKLVERIANATSLRVLVYPDDTKQLGGTTNAQAKALQNYPNCGFLHLEMTREVRDRLVKDERLQRAIVQCLADFQDQ